MSAEITSKTTAKLTVATLSNIQLTEPSIVKLKLNPSDVQSMRVEGRDLLIELTSGEIIRIVNFVAADGSQPNEVVRYCAQPS